MRYKNYQPERGDNITSIKYHCYIISAKLSFDICGEFKMIRTYRKIAHDLVNSIKVGQIHTNNYAKNLIINKARKINETDMCGNQYSRKI